MKKRLLSTTLPVRREYLLLIFLMLAVAACQSSLFHSDSAVVITEVMHNNTPHFKVESDLVTYYIEKQSGGCSSLLDKEGQDWVGFRLTGNEGPTLSSDSDYRGVPNLVFRDPGNGTGHPGFNTCETVQTSKNELEVRSRDSLWQFRWIFYDTFAEIRIEKSDASRAYWFLYEGPVAGKFAPDRQFWGNNVDGLRTDTPNIFNDPVSANWQWVFFGDTTVDFTLFVVKKEADKLNDFFCYMGNNQELGNASPDGMNVFGFGRSLTTTPLMEGPNSFYMGLFPQQVSDQKAVKQLNSFIRQLIH